MDNESLYRSLYRIRRFEEIVLEEFPRGRFSGTTHTYLGQEANAVGVLANLGAEDIVVSNHRCHGHFLAYGGEPRALFAELMGKGTGICGGRGGSQHLHWRNFYSNGILGGTVPLATGMALAEKQKETGSVVVVFLGDGALGEGVVYESLNMASLWKVPILFVLENNRIAQTTPVEMHLAGDISARFQAFGIPACEIESSDVFEILPFARITLEDVRQDESPQALILHTSRFGPHSKGDDTRTAEEIAALRRERDPLEIFGKRFEPEIVKKMQTEIGEQLAEAFQQALNDPFPG
jgi:TPP-dependent pyruvate/acetoin dehydrogenase alpha subunit